MNIINKTSKKNLTTLLTTLALILLLAFSTLASITPTATAHTPPIDIPTYAYIVTTPDRVGVGQTASVIFWLNWVPPGSGGTGGDRWRDLEVEVSKPDGSKEILGPFTSDPIGGGYSAYTPDQVGLYTFTFTFPGQVPSMYGPTGIISVNPALWDFIGDNFLPSSATTTLTVQEDPITQLPDYPLPTGYWTRPIEGQNTEWAKIASNWLGGEPSVTYNIQPDGIAPNSAHIMWTKPLQDGGIVGGTYPGEAYYQGDSYEMRFNNPMIINGRLYYDLPLSNAKTGGGYVCVDLLTGEELWWQNWTSSLPAFGQIYDYESINQHGVLPTGILWRTSGTTWEAYDSLTGSWIYTLTGVPSGTNIYGATGEITRYIFDSNNKWLALWNNTAAHGSTNSQDSADYSSTNYFQWRPVGKTIDASQAYSWNVTLPASVPSGSSITYVSPDDLLLCNTPMQAFGGNAAFGTIPYTVFAISLDPLTRGQVLWSKDYDAPDGNITRFLAQVDPVNRVFTTLDKETMQWSGYCLDNGDKLWGPVGDNLRDYTYYDSRGGAAGSSHSLYQGKLYVGGFNGLVYCYDVTNGNLLWTYGNGGEGNSTFSGTETIWGYYPTFLGAFADGKVYTFTQEHSVNMPIYKGASIRCLNATTGEELWTLPGFAASTSFYSRLGAIADGYLAYLNTYDGQVYVVGKGPSEVTVSAPDTAVPMGTPVLIQGTVTDKSAGAQEKVQSGEFNMVPAVSDENMSSWMQYIYMQKPKPTDATGVTVHLTACDPNGNTQEVGTTISNANGMYGIPYDPPVPGMYIITATFEGTESYWGSEATTYLLVTEAPSASIPPPTQPTTSPTSAPPTTTPPMPSTSPSEAPQPTSTTPTMTYVAVAAAIVAIAVIAAAVVLKRRK
ncbi:MAG: PQQ-binding-like beta-propeller repeat protein [Candidatus Bathyarchaeia archaeon]